MSTEKTSTLCRKTEAFRGCCMDAKAGHDEGLGEENGTQWAGNRPSSTEVWQVVPIHRLSQVSPVPIRHTQ